MTEFYHWTEIKPLKTDFGDRMTDGNMIEHDMFGKEDIEDVIDDLSERVPSDSSADEIIDFFISEGFLHPEWKNVRFLKKKMDKVVSNGSKPMDIGNAISENISEEEVKFF